MNQKSILDKHLLSRQPIVGWLYDQNANSLEITKTVFLIYFNSCEQLMALDWLFPFIIIWPKYKNSDPLDSHLKCRCEKLKILKNYTFLFCIKINDLVPDFFVKLQKIDTMIPISSLIPSLVSVRISKLPPYFNLVVFMYMGVVIPQVY